MAYTPRYVSYQTVNAFAREFEAGHPDLQTNSTNGRIPVKKPLILARILDELVRLGKEDNLADPMGHAKNLLNAHPRFMVTERRDPVLEAQDLYRQFPPLHGTGESSGGDGGESQGDALPDPIENTPQEGNNGQSQGGDGQGSQGQGEGEGNGNGDDPEDGDGDGDGDDQDQENQGQGSGNGEGQNQENNDQNQEGQGQGGEGDEDEDDSDEDPIPVPPQPVPIPPQPQQDEDQDDQDDQTLLAKLIRAMGYCFVKHHKGGFINIMGHAGLGKTFQARKAAEYYQAETFVQTAVDTASELLGTMALKEVNGASVTEFTPSTLVRALLYALEHPDKFVVIIQDEYDCLPNDVKTKLNSLLAPPFVLNVKGGVIDEIPMGPNVVFVAISNTAGHGGDELYPDRQLVDLSTMDRFYFNLVATFEEKTALKIAKGDEAFVSFLMDYNNSVAKSGQERFRASYRTIEAALANMEVGFSKVDFMPTLTKMATEQECAQLYEGLENKRGGWPQALKKYIDLLPKVEGTY